VVNDYETFLNQRAKAVSSALKKRLIPQDVDHTMVAAVPDDFYPDETENEKQ